MTLDDMIAKRDALIAARFGGVRHRASRGALLLLALIQQNSSPLALGGGGLDLVENS
jgi:hypothetical protein